MRKVLLKDTRNQRNMRRAGLIRREINQNSSLSKNACRRGLNGKMHVDQRSPHRYELVESALSGGVALSKVDAMRPFLEKYGQRLTSSATLVSLYLLY